MDIVNNILLGAAGSIVATIILYLCSALYRIGYKDDVRFNIEAARIATYQIQNQHLFPEDYALVINQIDILHQCAYSIYRSMRPLSMIWNRISKPQDALYKKLVQEMRDSDENMALATIQKLLMVCSHPRLVTKQAIQNASASELLKESPKLAWTVQLLKEIKKKREKVIIFTKYIAMQAILRQVIYEEFGIDSPIINGDVKGNRLKLIETFGGTPGFAVMILSPRAAGVGLNITAANHVVHYTREWNPAIENQATDRAYRIGQSKPVSVYYPVMESEEYISVEERLDELLSEKRHLMKSVILPTNLEIKAEQFYDLLT